MDCMSSDSFSQFNRSEQRERTVYVRTVVSTYKLTTTTLNYIIQHTTKSSAGHLSISDYSCSKTERSQGKCHFHTYFSCSKRSVVRVRYTCTSRERKPRGLHAFIHLCLHPVYLQIGGSHKVLLILSLGYLLYIGENS
jgi:hypothetical protein